MRSSSADIVVVDDQLIGCRDKVRSKVGAWPKSVARLLG